MVLLNHWTFFSCLRLEQGSVKFCLYRHLLAKAKPKTMHEAVVVASVSRCLWFPVESAMIDSSLCGSEMAKMPVFVPSLEREAWMPVGVGLCAVLQCRTVRGRNCSGEERWVFVLGFGACYESWGLCVIALPPHLVRAT